MDQSPPSSKRKRVKSTDMPVTFLSYLMKRLADLMDRYGRRGLYVMLITNPDDTAELTALATMVATRRGHADPLVIRSSDDTIIRPDGILKQEDNRGILITRAEWLAMPKEQPCVDMLAADFIRCMRDGPPRCLFIANFANRKACDEVVKTWPEDIRGRFSTNVLEWPALRERRADISGILENICAQFTSRDDAVRAEIAPDAAGLLTREALERKGASVATLRRRIRDAFDVMLRCQAPQITAQHLRVAANPHERSAFFASIAAVTT